MQEQRTRMHILSFEMTLPHCSSKHLSIQWYQWPFWSHCTIPRSLDWDCRLSCRNLKDEINYSYNCGGVVYLLQIELSISSIQYSFHRLIVNFDKMVTKWWQNAKLWQNDDKMLSCDKMVTKWCHWNWAINRWFKKAPKSSESNQGK